MMDNHPKCPAVADAILHWLENGLVVEEPVRNYLRSVFADRSLPELALFLEQEDGCERDSLLDLLLFPDEALKIRLETVMGREAFGPGDEQAVVRLLSGRRPKALIRFREEETGRAIPVPDYLAENLVARLRLCRPPDPRIIASVAAHVPPADVPSVLVKIRHAEVPPNPAMIGVLCRFFETCPFRDSRFSADMAFLLAFAGELDPAEAPEQALSAKRRKLGDQLRKDLLFLERLRGNNMEIMMLAGCRASGPGPDRIRESMDIIDRLLDVLFQRREQSPECRESRFRIGGEEPRKELDAVFRLLA
ncbi:MAG: hypothetical protein ACOZF0_24245 [Thermodesulfobacteriota bacterium]